MRPAPPDDLSVITLGCRLNGQESDVMRSHARAAGVRGAVVVNTCAVTSDAVRRSRQAVRRARKDNPGAAVIVTGCAAQIDPDGFAALEAADLVIGNAEKTDPQVWRGIAGTDFGVAGAEKVRVNDIFSVRETAGHMIAEAEGLQDRTRAYLQVQNGCDHRCTFCIIPYGRGKARSVPMGDAVEHAKRLSDAGYREIVLTGVDITSYGADLPGGLGLGRLAQKILNACPGLARLRLSSIDSIEADEALLDLVESEPRFAPHLHLSLQSGDDMILKRMKRRHGRRDAIRLCERLRARRPEIAFGADLIAGFPTETEEMFENTLSIVDACGLSYVHVFPFSPRAGTPAARMPQVERAVVKARAARLRAAAEAARAARWRRLSGARHEILTEADGRGRTACFAPVRLPDAPSPGRLVHRRIVGWDADGLIAGPAEGAPHG